MEPPKEIGPVGRPEPVSSVRRAPPPAPEQAQRAGDSVTISREGQHLLALRRRITEAPDVREDLVERLRRDIAEGRYRPSAEAIARRLLRALRPREP